MVVDDQDSDANHETPFPGLSVELGITPSPGDDTTARTTTGHAPSRGDAGRIAAGPPGRCRAVTAPAARASCPAVPLSDRHRPPPALCFRVRAGAGRGRIFAELALPRVYGEPHVSSGDRSRQRTT